MGKIYEKFIDPQVLSGFYGNLIFKLLIARLLNSYYINYYAKQLFKVKKKLLALG